MTGCGRAAVSGDVIGGKPLRSDSNTLHHVFDFLSESTRRPPGHGRGPAEPHTDLRPQIPGRVSSPDRPAPDPDGADRTHQNSPPPPPAPPATPPTRHPPPAQQQYAPADHAAPYRAGPDPAPVAGDEYSPAQPARTPAPPNSVERPAAVGHDRHRNAKGGGPHDPATRHHMGCLRHRRHPMGLTASRPHQTGPGPRTPRTGASLHSAPPARPKRRTRVAGAHGP